MQKSSGPSVEFIYRLEKGGTWFRDGEFTMISPKFPHRSRNSALYSVVQGRDAFLDVTVSLSHPFIFQDLRPCSNFSCNAGLYLNHDMDLTEEDIQIWYFGPDGVGTKSKCPRPCFFFVSLYYSRCTHPTMGNIEYLGESHCVSCTSTNYASPNYHYSTYGYIAPFELFQVVHETR